VEVFGMRCRGGFWHHNFDWGARKLNTARRFFSDCYKPS
jgi:uncharacterized protein (UPF0303 family)